MSRWDGSDDVEVCHECKGPLPEEGSGWDSFCSDTCAARCRTREMNEDG